jgi:hypothetical protein
LLPEQPDCPRPVSGVVIIRVSVNFKIPR